MRALLGNVPCDKSVGQVKLQLLDRANRKTVEAKIVDVGFRVIKPEST
jgi:hypothetical protein